MELITKEEFKKNYELDITKLVETIDTRSFKAKYISWANAQNLLRERYPALAVAFEKTENGSPVFSYNDQAFVQAYLTDGDNRTPSIFYPVMTQGFDAVSNPSVTQINKACQRATAKAIAVFTGLGLKLYIGEDLVDDPQETRTSYKEPEKFTGDWASYKIPIGKYAREGKNLGEVMEENPAYVTGFLLDPAKFEFKSDNFKNACLAAVAAVGATAADIKITSDEITDDISGQTASDPELDEEVPF